MATRTIGLRGVRVNNLQNIDLDIPHGQWLAICGLSGSGKSSLAFDTLYAQGQRRYLECLSPGARQFVSALDKPDADSILGMPPAIAVQAIRGKPDHKTTVGNAADVIEHLRLLFVQLGRALCPDCELEVRQQDPQSVAFWIERLSAGTKFMVAFEAESAGKSTSEIFSAGRRNGFTRAIVGERTVNLDSPGSGTAARETERATDRANVSKGDCVWLVVDRLAAGSSDLSRVRESLETAFQFGDGACCVLVETSGTEIAKSSLTDSSGPEARATSAPSKTSHVTIDGRSFERHRFSIHLTCSQCGRHFPQPLPKLFSFNHPMGACCECDGVGFLKTPKITSTTATSKVRHDFQTPCPACQGDRLNSSALSFRVAGHNIAEISRMEIRQAEAFFENAKWSPAQFEVSERLLHQIQARLKFLVQVGLGYLTLDRPLRTLSGGEAQRVALTSCLSSTLVTMLYVLDEPSAGLHPHDVENLIQSIGQLNQRGNTVVVVDHEEAMIRAAPRIVELGPGAGAEGGEIVFDGTLAELLETDGSPTGDFLTGKRGGSKPENRRPGRGKLKITGARGHNLKNIDVEFPLGCLCVVSGVSGAGKSSLVQQTLYGALCQRKNVAGVATLPFEDLLGDGLIDDVVLVDPSPIGRTPRSNPVTYVKAFDDIRKAFAETPDARLHNVKAGQFSFNVPGGRCDKCIGDGQLTIDMQFLSDVYIKCDQCNGTRYRDETLAVRYRGLNIAEVLNLTVREAFTFFRGQPKVQAKLKALIDVGLEYIRLGQPATTLSTGEAQRLKLGVYLNASKKKRALFLLEEPTTGLHMADVTRLIDCFDALLAVGHSFIIVEHNRQLMRYADWMIDVGPGAGAAGGQVVVAGTPEDVAACAESVTGRYL